MLALVFSLPLIRELKELRRPKTATRSSLNNETMILYAPNKFRTFFCRLMQKNNLK